MADLAIPAIAVRRATDSLRKHAYSNKQKISPPKTETFQIKTLIFFHISAQNIDCGYPLEPPRRGGSNEYTQSMFLIRNKKNNVTPVNPSFTIQKWGLTGSKLYTYVFVMCTGARRVREEALFMTG